MNILTYRLLLLSISIFISVTQFSFSQNKTNDVCGYTSSKETISYYQSIKPRLKAYETDFLTKKMSSKSSTASSYINSIPVKAHVIRNSDGSGGIGLSELHAAIENLNSLYAEAYLEFFLCDDINYIDDDALCNFKKGDEKNLMETQYVSGLINIYFTHNIENVYGDNLCGYSDNVGRNDVVVIKNSCAINESSLPHEIGHYFSLLHTHGADNIGITSELVDGSNCDTDGDGICDTPADPKLTSANVDEFCNYKGSVTDANGQLFTPDTGNMMSYASKNCRTHFSQQQLARMYAFYMTTKNYLSCPSFNANISVSENETCEESLTVRFESLGLNISNWQWDVDGDGIVDYTTKNPTHTYDKGIYDVVLKASSKSKTITRVYKNFIKVGTGVTSLEENFEDFDLIGNHGWSNYDISGNGYHWYSNIGETLSSGTGPSLLRNSEATKNSYIYAEASGATAGDETALVSPCVYIPYENSELEFSYHMFGKGIGELHVDIKTDSGYINDVIPPLIGSQQNEQTEPFKIKNVDLSDYAYETIKVRFRAVRGNNWDGDIAIDNVLLKTIHTAISDEIFKVYPNPVTDNLLYAKNNNPSEAAYFTIRNLMGQIFLTGTVNNHHPIDISHLSSGSYLLSITNGKSTVVKRFIK